MVIHKSVSPYGDWIIFMSGHMLYKKWPDGRSLLFDKWGHPISNRDRDNSISAIAPTPENADVTSSPDNQWNRDILIKWVSELLEDVCADEELIARATKVYEVAADALRWKADEKLSEFGIAELRDNFNLKTLIDLHDPMLHPTMPIEIRRPIRLYLESLPGYQAEMGHKQSQETFDWHGQAEMDLTKLFGKIQEKYDYLFAFDDIPFIPARNLDKAAPSDDPIPDDIVEITRTLADENDGSLAPEIVQCLLYTERMRWLKEIERLRTAADYISPYLRWTVGDESPGYAPTMPSAVAAFHVAFDIDTAEKRIARTRQKTADAVAANKGNA